MEPSFAEVRHLVTSGEAAVGLLRQAGATKESIFFSSDVLTVGPCSGEPYVHLAMRTLWNRGWDTRILSLDDLRQATDGHTPVAVWATFAPADLLWLIWALDGLSRISVRIDQLRLVRPMPPDRSQTLGGVTVEQARAAFASATRVSEGMLREASTLWNLFTSSTPSTFGEACWSANEAFPELRAVGNFYGACFPTVRAGQLRLAKLDEVLLRTLDDAWRTTADILDKMQDRDAFIPALGPFLAIRRLRNWAEHRVIERDARGATNPFLQDAFRATQLSQRLLDTGMSSVGEAPPLCVGGCVVNLQDIPWVMTEVSSCQRILLFGVQVPTPSP
jgi:hypothetical protein